MQLIAMHGWAGDSHGWAPWHQACQARGWSWQSGDRGYGSLSQAEPHWNEEPPKASQRRVVIAHSMGVHLLPAEVLSQADAVVLLASFGRFIPEGNQPIYKAPKDSSEIPLGAYGPHAREARERAMRDNPVMLEQLLRCIRVRALPRYAPIAFVA